MSASERAACWIGAVLEAGLLLLALVQSGGVRERLEDPLPAILLYLTTTLVYLTGLLGLHRRAGEIRGRFILGFALLFRLTAFCIPPLFSDDLYRYRWE